MPLQAEDDKRLLPDRRNAPTSAWDTLLGVGCRMRLRRRHEHASPYFVDRFASSTLAVILALLGLSILDAVITIRLVDAGGDEINPIMDWLLRRGVVPFLIGKYVLTAAGLPVLLIFQNHTLFGTRFRVSYLIPMLVGAYLSLIVYQLTLLRAHVGV